MARADDDDVGRRDHVFERRRLQVRPVCFGIASPW
jgi:hypothetical protein